MSKLEKILKLTKQLYPKGAAFNYNLNSFWYKLHKGLAQTESTLFEETEGVLDHILPDNDNFNEFDATIWEKRLGLITNALTPLADRKAAIITKLNHPGIYPALQSIDHLENVLRGAGFDVYCFQNLDEQTPEEVLFDVLEGGEMGDDSEMGDVEMIDPVEYYPDFFSSFEMGDDAEMGDVEMNGFSFNQLVVNNIDEIKDSSFDYYSNLRQTFFVCGNPFGTIADVSNSRKDEFRQLILRTKPVESVGFLLVNYI